MGRMCLVISLSVCLVGVIQATFLGFPRPFIHPVFPLMPRPIIPLAPIPMPIHLPYPVYKKRGYAPRRRTTRKRQFITTGTNVRGINVGGGGGFVDRRGPPINAGRNDVIVIVNDRDCYGGFCGGAGPMMGGMNRFTDSIDGSLFDQRDFGSRGLGRMGPSPGLGNGNYNIQDADTVVIGGNGRGV